MNIIRYVGSTQCNDRMYQQALRDGDSLLVDWVSSEPNATVSFTLDGKPLAPDLTGTWLDFPDIGTLVYLADEMVNRSQANDYWTRTIRCIVPVTDASRWEQNGGLLSRTLELVSGDIWQFDWLQMSAPRPLARHRQHLPSGFDAVCLFSGGTDSLLGAIRLLQDGKKLILVGHQAEGQTASAQKELAESLQSMFPGRTCLLQYRASRSTRETPRFDLSPKVERSHRPRSFLFLTLGIGIALQCGIGQLYMPENGLMALNIPLQKSRIGSLSTRTAHPAYMLSFADLAQRITGFGGSIRNTFLTQSKTDMLRGLDPSLQQLVLRSISCSRPSRFNDRGVHHCGYCVPCIHRRIALMEAGIDSGGDYAFDVFSDFDSLDARRRQDISALATFASRVVGASETQLQTLILSHVHFPPNASSLIGNVQATDYRPWTHMVRTWADDFLAKLSMVTSATARRSLGVISRRRRLS